MQLPVAENAIGHNKEAAPFATLAARSLTVSSVRFAARSRARVSTSIIGTMTSNSTSSFAGREATRLAT